MSTISSINEEATTCEI